MPSTTERRTTISPAPAAGPRLRMQQDRSGRTLLDGGWWPRSADPAAELSGLIPALDERHGRIARVMLGTAGWNASRPHRLYLGGPETRRVVKLGWFDTMPGGLLTAISASGGRTDLVTIPPRTSEQAAWAAMQQAAEAGNREHAPAILAAIIQTADETPASIGLGVRERDGGRSRDHDVVPDLPQSVSEGQFPCAPVAGRGSS
jgi:uncharacterized protein DUF5994